MQLKHTKLAKISSCLNKIYSNSHICNRCFEVISHTLYKRKVYAQLFKAFSLISYKYIFFFFCVCVLVIFPIILKSYCKCLHWWWGCFTRCRNTNPAVYWRKTIATIQMPQLQFFDGHARIARHHHQDV